MTGRGRKGISPNPSQTRYTIMMDKKTKAVLAAVLAEWEVITHVSMANEIVVSGAGIGVCETINILLDGTRNKPPVGEGTKGVLSLPHWNGVRHELIVALLQSDAKFRVKAVRSLCKSLDELSLKMKLSKASGRFNLDQED